MKRCPTCNRTFTDQNLSYCIDDGTPLVPITDDESTVVSAKESTGRVANNDEDWKAVAYRPPTAYVPPDAARKSKTWPWVVGILAFLLIAGAGLSLAAWFLLPRVMRESGNRNDNVTANINANTRTAPGSTTNANANNANQPFANTNATPGANTNAGPPTDKEQVLAQLTDLENEWTVANINADKKKLEVILADDYVGPAQDGQMEGKREYIRDIKRDTSIERWDFQDLKLTLRGDRATLTGKVKLRINNRDVVYEFTDKFVWRDGRWQATGSVVSEAG